LGAVIRRIVKVNPSNQGIYRIRNTYLKTWKF